MSHGWLVVGALAGVALAGAAKPVAAQVAMASDIRSARASAPLVASPAPTAHPADETAWLDLHPWPSAAAALVQDDGPPANLHVAPDLREAVEQMWQHSPTFRYQCARIAAEPSLTVTVALRPWGPGARERARASLKTMRGERRASISLTPLEDHRMWLAHELEHVVEWIDNANYDMARRSTPPGRICHGDDVETMRAIRAGERVAQEVGASRR